MDKPIFLIPFIYVYKTVAFVFNSILNFIKYTISGFMWSLIILANTFIIVSKFIYLKIFLTLKLIIIKVINYFLLPFKYAQKGIMTIISLIAIGYSKYQEKAKKKQVIKQQKQKEKQAQLAIKKAEKGKILAEKKKQAIIKETEKKAKQQALKEKKAQLPPKPNPLIVLTKNISKGFLYLNYFVYKFLKYIIMGFLFPFIVFSDQNRGKLSESSSRRLEKKIAKEEALAKKLDEPIVKKPKKETISSLNTPIKFIKYIVLGTLISCFFIYRLIKLNIFALLFPFIYFLYLINNLFNAFATKTRQIKDQKVKTPKIKRKGAKLIGEKTKKLTPAQIASQKRKEHLAKIKADREAVKLRKKAQRIADRERKEELEAKRKAEEIYFKRQELYGKKPKRRKEKEVKEDFTTKILGIPKNIKSYFQSKVDRLAIVKNKKNRLALEREALLMSVDSDDAVKSKVKLYYLYVARDPDGKIVRGQFEAQSKVEVHSYLLSEGYEVYSIKTNKWISFLYGKPKANKTKIKTSHLIFFLTQLSTYIKAGIPLVDALKILTKQYKKKSYQRIFKTMIYDLTMGENFSAAMDKQGVAFPRLLINMVKAAEMTGELPEALDNMAEYFDEVEKTRRQMVTALIYPVMVILLSVVVITFIILFVIPRFVEIYATLDADQIPMITNIIIGLSAFMQANIIILVLGFMVITVIFNYMYANIKLFKIFIQWLLMHLPVFKNIIIFNEVTIFSKTFSSLLAHNVFITDSMEVLNSITENEIYKMIILDTVNNLAKGEKISESFKDHWAFPIPAYEMLVTGEKTGQLPEMMSKVADYYQELHRQAVTRMKTILEPALIVFLTFVVGLIVLAVVIPMFNMFTMIQQ